MPIGKNAIKRVENNGYSNVKTSAPDMENSSVVAPAAEAKRPEAPKEVEPAKAPELSVQPVKAKRGRPPKSAKANAVKAPEKAVESPKTVSSNPKSRKGKNARKSNVRAVKNEKNGFERVEVGGEMPYWLL